MDSNRKPTVDEILKKYSGKIEGKIKTTELGAVKDSKAYLKFREESERELTGYERWCNTLGSIIKLNPSKKDAEKIQKNIGIAHMNIEPWQAITFSVVAFLLIFFLGILLSVAYALMKGGIEKFPFLFFFLIMMVSIFSFYYFNNYPARFANKWKLKASSQMVPAILYVVVYMRHTPNLEKAIAFASEHLQYPLALDFKKVFYNVAIGKFPTIKESLDNYLEGWRDYSVEFIEAFHLIESSLYEPDRERRIATLEKSLQVVLDGVYEKMLKFTHDVKAPMTNVYMLAIMLPVLGIALIPLASAMLQGAIKWVHVFVLYTMIIPFLAFFMLDKILLLRPGGYGEISYLERNPLYPQYKSKEPYFAAFLICLPLIILSLLPLIFQYTGLPAALGLPNDPTLGGLLGMDSDTGILATPLFDFVETDNGIVGPFGFMALIFSLFFPLGIALFFSIAYKDRTLNIIVERNKTKRLEDEFNNSLFQLGNRLGGGTPPELVFGKVAESSKGLVAGEFFRKVNYNIQQMGMSVEKAIFDSRRGVILFYPSDLIATSMKVLIESSKKGLNIAAVSLMSISEYVKNIQRITERLKDILAEIVSEMKSNMTFLAPLLAGIVVGLAMMITSILGILANPSAGVSSDLLNFGNLTNILQIFQRNTMIPPYYLQIAIGLYLIEVIFILTGTLVTIDSGEDKLERTKRIGENLRAGMLFYFLTALLSSLLLFVLSSVVLKGIGS